MRTIHLFSNGTSSGTNSRRRAFAALAALTALAMLAVLGTAMAQPLRMPTLPGGDSVAERGQSRQPGGRLAGLAERGQSPQPLGRLAGPASLAALADRSWRWRGPFNVGGRANGLAIDPRNPKTMYASTDSGGLWKTADGGASWASVSDALPSQAFAGVAVDPRDSRTVYAVTNSILAWQGIGVFKSADGGASWQLLKSTAYRPEWIYAQGIWVLADGTVLASGYSRLLRSGDGGTSWKEVLPSTVNSMVVDPGTPQHLLAGGWGGAGPQVWQSTDGGRTWTAADYDVPAVDVGGASKVVLAWCAADPRAVYAVYRAGSGNVGSVWRSNSGGKRFTKVVSDLTNDISAPPARSLAVWVDPSDASHVLAGGANLWRSHDGGQHFQRAFDSESTVQRENFWGITGIYSAPGFNGGTARTVYVTHDAGIRRTDDIYGAHAADDWASLNNGFGSTQFNGVSGNPGSGALVGGTYFNGTQLSPDGGLTWHEMTRGGTNHVWPVMDPGSAAFFGLTTYGSHPNEDETGALHLYRGKSTDSDYSAEPNGEVVDGNDLSGTGGSGSAPLAFDPGPPKVLYAGAGSLWRLRDPGAAQPAWQSIKPKLTAAVCDGDTCVVTAIGLAPGQPDWLWVGYNEGQLYVTHNAQAANPDWTFINPRAVKLPERVPNRIIVDPADPKRVFIAYGWVWQKVPGPSLFRTLDGGATWSAVTGSDDGRLPEVNVLDLALHPDHPQMLFAATQLGVWASDDDGAHWIAFDPGLPAVATMSLQWMGRELLAGTFGRGAWSIDLADLAGPGAALPTRTPGPTPTTPPICSIEGGADTNVYFDNRRAGDVKTYWADLDCVEQFTAIVKPGKVGGGPTTLGYVWRVRDGATGALLAQVRAATEAITVVLQADVAPGTPAPTSRVPTATPYLTPTTRPVPTSTAPPAATATPTAIATPMATASATATATPMPSATATPPPVGATATALPTATATIVSAATVTPAIPSGPIYLPFVADK